MTTITIDELRDHLDDVADRLAHGGERVAVTRGGVAVFELSPAAPDETDPAEPRPSPEEVEAYMAEWRDLAADIGKRWPKAVSALDAIREDRDRLDTITERRGER